MSHSLRTIVLLHLFYLYCTHATIVQMSTIMRDITARQIPGTYENVPMAPGVGFCADRLQISQVEPLQTANGVLFVIPHLFISLPLAEGPTQTCTSTPVTDSSITTSSATVLRRSSQLTLDTSVDLIAQFELADEEFFIGFEVGPRICGRLTLPASSISMWVAPDKPITATAGIYQLTFHPGSKYIYYFSNTQPCLYRGNAAEVGLVATVTTPRPTPTPLSAPTVDDGNTVDDDGTDTDTATPNSPSPPSPIVPPVDNSAPGPAAPPGASADTSASDGPACFPAHATVLRSDGLRVRMERLRAGDEVFVGRVKGVDGRVRRLYSPVFMFTHALSRVTSRFVRLEMTGNRTLLASEGHFVYARGRVLRAGDVRVGDVMVDGESGGENVVREISMVSERGLYNPQTLHGDIVVDGVLVTTYTSVFGSVGVSHALLAPVRMVHWLVGDGRLVERVRIACGIGV